MTYGIMYRAKLKAKHNKVVSRLKAKGYKLCPICSINLYNPKKYTQCFNCFTLKKVYVNGVVVSKGTPTITQNSINQSDLQECNAQLL